MMKKIVTILIIFLFFLITFGLNPKESISEENFDITFILRNVEGEETLIKKGKGKFINFKYNLSETDGNYKLNLSGKGAIEFIVIFENYQVIFPEKRETFNSPIIILKNSDNNYLFFSVPYDNLYYFEFFSEENRSSVSFNIYLKGKENIIFNIKNVNSLEEAFDEYFEIYKEKNREIDNGGLLVPDTSFSRIRELGTSNFNIKYRIVDPKEDNAVDRINEASFFGIENFVILNPLSLKFENLSIDDVVSKLYFDKDVLSKLDGIVLLTSGIKDKNDELISYTKKSEPTYEYVSNEPVVDYKENSYDTIFLLNPSPQYLKNKGISAYDIFYNRYINPLNLSIKYYNNELGLKSDKRSRYSGYVLDFSDVIDTFNYNEEHFDDYPTSYIDGKECQFYLISLYDFLKNCDKNSLILSINPKYFQLTMNSDLIYKEIDTLDEISNFPTERILVRNRPIYYSYKLNENQINAKNLKKIFDFSLFYGIYPTFSNPDNEPFSIWDNKDKLNELIPFIKYYDFISQIEKRGFVSETYSSISNGNLLRFGNYPEIFFTIYGNGLLTIDKNSLNIDDNFKIVDLLEDKELEYKVENGVIKLNISNEKVIKISSKENQIQESSIVNTKNINFDINFLLPLILIFLSLIINKYKIFLKINFNFVITVLFLILLIIKFFLNITSPYFLFLSIGIISLLTSLYETEHKKRFLLNFSIIFFIISFIYHLLTKSKINIVPPFYPYFDLYYFLIILFFYLFIFYHFKWKLSFDFFIFLSFFISFFLTNLFTTPFYSPPYDLSFLINIIILIFIISIISFKNYKNFLFFMIFILGFIFYIFWDKIYYFLLLRNIFISYDFLIYFLTLFLIYYLVTIFFKKKFKTKPDMGHSLLFLLLILNSLILNYIHLYVPNKFSSFSSISRIIFYIIIIIYVIYFSELLLTKKEE